MKCHPTAVVLAVSLTAVLGLSACSSPQTPAGSTAGRASAAVTEATPAGDIPDNQAYVAATAPSGSYRLPRRLGRDPHQFLHHLHRQTQQHHR